MWRAPANRRSRARLAAVVVALIVSAPAPLPASEGDDALLRSLDESSPVDRKALARLLFGTAATLEGGKTSVRLLQSAGGGRDAASQSVREMLGARYAGYDQAVGRFKSAVSRLLDQPESPTRLYESLSAGRYACFRLDGFTRLAETYGASTGELLSVISSLEGCESFHRAAFHPRVEGLIKTALAASEDDREVRELREELRAMEELLEDLRRIDEAE